MDQLPNINLNPLFLYMVESKLLFYLSILIISFSCQGIDAQDDHPDPNLADVYKPLDGTWKGKFYIYELPEAQDQKRSIPKKLTLEYFYSLPLQVVDSVTVTQKYASSSPYYQTVVIEDSYYDEAGNEKIIQSKGVNKVKGKSLLCIVNKPDETVIHQGTLPSPNTIIWQRKEKAPLKIEYFKETVRSNTYDIIGYGYYGEENPRKNPKTWFKSQYVKQ